MNNLLTDYIKQQIIAHANQFPEEEVIGLVLKSGEVIPSKNIIETTELEVEGELLNKKTGALIDDELLNDYEFEIAAIYHSHWSDYDPALLSPVDIHQSRVHNIPFILYHSAFKQWDYFDPSYPHPFPLKEKGDPKSLEYYLNWPFIFGRSDCSSLFISYFKNIYDHIIPDHPRPLDGEWYKNPKYESLYLKCMEDPKRGFVKTNRSEPKKGDFCLVRFFGSPHPSRFYICFSQDI